MSASKLIPKVSVKKIKPMLTKAARSRKIDALTKNEERILKAIKDFIKKNEDSYLILRVISPTDYIIGRRLPVIIYEMNNNNPFHPYERKAEGYHCAFCLVNFKEFKPSDKFERSDPLIVEMRTIGIETCRINKPEEVSFYLQKIGKL